MKKSLEVLCFCVFEKFGFWVVVGLGGGQRGGQGGAQVVRSVQSEVDRELHRWLRSVDREVHSVDSELERCRACIAPWWELRAARSGQPRAQPRA